MRIALRRLLVAAAVLLLVASSAWADIHIELVQGKRTVTDKVSFTVEITHERVEDPRYAKMPEFIEITATFLNPASGTVSIDGTGIGRFDETLRFNSNRTEITYGRHVITLQVSAPAVVTRLSVFVRGGLPREVIGETAAVAPARPAASLEDRIAELERRVKQLEAEVESLKKARRVP
ncbi:MAG TPA: hypothetical protein VJH03_22305 [Blastocatellia bacterium]|nr:hypothetical protein [Blastocatellia bacterium]